MRIESSQLQLSSSRVYERKETVSEKLEAWIGERRPEAERPPLIDFSKEALALLEGAEGQTAVTAPESVEDEEELLSADDKLKIRLIEYFLSAFTGKKVKLRIPQMNLKHPETPGYTRAGLPAGGGAQQPPRAGWGIAYDRRHSLREYEHTDFNASGTVTTADGREIRLEVSLHMERSYAEDSSLSIRAGDALKDPLVLNFSGSVPGLSEKTFSFDLDLDGTADQISLLKSGSGFLALDTNENGRIDDGSELFGPRTDSGFGELREYDSDRNGWIDENDAVFNSLRIWQKDDSGNDKLLALGEVGIGAIYLGHVSTEFTLRQLEVQGRIRDSGIFLKESGQAGILQEIDMKI